MPHRIFFEITAGPWLIFQLSFEKDSYSRGLDLDVNGFPAFFAKLVHGSFETNRLVYFKSTVKFVVLSGPEHIEILPLHHFLLSSTVVSETLRKGIIYFIICQC